MKIIGPIRVRKGNWCTHAAILSALLSSFSAIASPATPHDVVDCDHPGELVSLNLDDVDIGILIETVAQLSGKNIIIDPRVEAQVTHVSDVLLDSKQLYNVFLSILEVHNLAVIDVDHTTIMVIPKDTVVLNRSFEIGAPFSEPTMQRC